MYEIYNGFLTITFNEWKDAGLTRNQFEHDSKGGDLVIVRRGINGNTRIDVRSIRRPERMRAIEGRFGKIDADNDKTANSKVVFDSDAYSYYTTLTDDKGNALTDNRIRLYTNGASVMNTLVNYYQNHRSTIASLNKRFNAKMFYGMCLEFSEGMQKEFPHQLPRNRRSFERKFKEYVRNGYEVLVKDTSSCYNSERLTNISKRWIVARWADPVNKCTLFQLFEEYNDLAYKNRWKQINSIATIDNYLNRAEVRPLWYGARYGELKAKEQYTRMHKTKLPSMRDSLWYSDGTKLNYYYLNEYGNIDTCCVYEVVDVHTECLLGYHISKSEDFESQYYAFKHAVQFAGCKPYEVKFDNQGGHKKLMAGEFFNKLARVAINTQPYNGKSKTIESIFGRFQSEFLHKDWYFTGQNITAKKEESKANMEFILANKKSLPTLDEIKKQYDRRRNEWNNSTQLSKKGGKSRIDLYVESRNDETPKVEIWDMITLFGIVNPTPIKYRSNGIAMTVKRQEYKWEVLNGGMPDLNFLRKNVGREFHVGYDPDDMTVVMLYEKTSNGFRYVSTAEKYIEIHRNLQEQNEFDHVFIKAMDKANKQLRVAMVEETEKLLEDHGMHPAQRGLVMPKIKGIGKKIDGIGAVMKRESNLVAAEVDDVNVYDLY